MKNNEVHDGISIIVPTIGKSPYLDDALSSILESAPADAEVLLFLNGCPDLAIQPQHRSDPRLRTHSCSQRLPPTQSWNTAVKLASGPHILFIGDDDRLDHGFENWWKSREDHADFIIMGIHRIDSEGRRLPFEPNGGGKICQATGSLAVYTSDIKCYLGGVIFSKSNFNKVGGFEDLKMSNGWFLDTYLWSRLIRVSNNPIIDNSVTWCYRINQYQMGYKTNMQGFVKELDLALEVIVASIPESTDHTKRRLRRHLIYARALSNIRNAARRPRKIDFAIALGITARYCGLVDMTMVLRERALRKKPKEAS